MNHIPEFEEFDEIGFGNQARIVGVKRVELKDFIRENFVSKSQLREVLKMLRYQQPPLGTPETTERVMLAVNGTLDDFSKSLGL